MGVASVPYHVNIPYGVMELRDETVMSLKEKPTYVYYSNAGIYFLRKWVKDAKENGGAAFPGRGKQRPDDAELSRLWRELAKTKAERDILALNAAELVFPNLFGAIHALGRGTPVVNVAGLVGRAAIGGNVRDPNGIRLAWTL